LLRRADNEVGHSHAQYFARIAEGADPELLYAARATSSCAKGRWAPGDVLARATSRRSE
jgi:hypothetical protein